MTKLGQESSPNEWDPELDGVIAAPDSHVVLFEDETCRVLLVELPPGRKEPFHHHARRSNMIVTNSAPLRYYNEGGATFDIAERDISPDNPYAEDMEPEPLHAVENLSPDKTYYAWRVEYKN